MTVVKFDAERFILDIQELVKSDNHTTYMDALVHYSEYNDIEIETIADLVKKIPVLKVSLLEEAENLNLVEKSAKLPT